MYSESRKAKAIEVTLESYLYLQRRLHRERSNKEVSDKVIDRLTINFNRVSKDGFKTLMDGDLGGCKDGRWTSWSAKEMSEMLDAEGLEWRPAEDVEYIAVGF